MIVYNPRQWHGLVVLLSLQGSPLPQGAAFGLATCDEAQVIKNHQAQVSQVCVRTTSHSRARIACTGTPIDATPLLSCVLVFALDF